MMRYKLYQKMKDKKEAKNLNRKLLKSFPLKLIAFSCKIEGEWQQRNKWEQFEGPQSSINFPYVCLPYGLINWKAYLLITLAAAACNFITLKLKCKNIASDKIEKLTTNWNYWHLIDRIRSCSSQCTSWHWNYWSPISL